MSKDRRYALPAIALLTCAFAWGSTTVVMKSAFDVLTPLGVLASRLILTGLTLAPFAYQLRGLSRGTLLRGALLGAIFNSGLAAQTVGLEFTPASVSGFVVASYVVFTALITAVFMKTPLRPITWISVLLTVAGIGILALGQGGAAGFGYGAVLTLGGALCFAIHIVLLGHWVTKQTVLPLTVLQALTGLVIGVVLWPISGSAVPADPGTWVQLLYLGIFCGGVTLFLQSWAQNYVPPTVAAIVMCSEPVWGALLAIGLGQEALRGSVLLGGGLVVLALLLSASPQRKRRHKRLDELLTELRRRR